MLFITGTAKIDPDRRAEALEEALPAMRASQAEEGCHDYVFFPDPTRPDTIRIFEQWESEEALQAHFQTPQFAEAGGVMRKFEVSDLQIAKYQIASSGPVFD